MWTPGDIVEVELDLGRAAARPVDPSLLDAFLLGRGYNAARLLALGDRCPAPLAPENPLLITCGLLTGSGAPTAARLHLSARSPLTGLTGSSSVGGTVGPAFHSRGVAALEVRGAAPRPVYLLLDDAGVEVRSAEHLWGLDSRATAERLRADLGGSGLAMLIIGPAGENRVPMASVVTQRGHAAGRTGMGAVMGSKHLKAVVVRTARGRRVGPAESAGREAGRAYADAIKAGDGYEESRAWGTSYGVLWTDRLGMLATRNYQAGVFEGAAAIDGTSMDRYVRRRRACQACPVHCKAELEFGEGSRLQGLEVERPDFEPLVAWGSKAGVSDPEAVLYLHHLCDTLGLDSVSAGSAAAFGIALYEEGIVTRADTGGLELTWGDADTLEVLVRQMAAGEGFGGLLGKGVKEAAAQIGRGAERHAMHVKGLELTAQDPRGTFACGLGYAVGNRGGDFTNVYARHDYVLTPEQAETLYGAREAADRFSTVGKAAMVRRSMIVCAVLDAIGICKFPALSLINAYDLVGEARLISAFTGLEVGPDELFKTGERILNAERVFNLHCGLEPEDDRLPAAFLDDPLPDGPCAGRTVDLEPMLREFYALMGWDERGRPTLARLRELGLEAPPPADGPEPVRSVRAEDDRVEEVAS